MALSENILDEDENVIAFESFQQILKLTDKTIELAEKCDTIWDNVQTDEDYDKAYKFENDFATKIMPRYLNALEEYSHTQRESANLFFKTSKTEDGNGDYIEINYESHFNFAESLERIKYNLECFADSLDYDEEEIS